MNFQFKINFPFYLAIKLQMNNIKLTIAIATQSPLRVSIAKILNPIKDFIWQPKNQLTLIQQLKIFLLTKLVLRPFMESWNHSL